MASAKISAASWIRWTARVRAISSGRWKRMNFYKCSAGRAEPAAFAAWVRDQYRSDWVVYAKPPFGGPEYVLQYLARYTHRYTPRWC